MSKKIEKLHDYKEEAEKRKSSFSKTDKYRTNLSSLNTYMGFGFGKPYGYEIVTVFGESGVGKSTFCLNLLAYELSVGTRVGMMILEDDIPDVYLNLAQIIGETGMDSIERNENVELLPEKMREQIISFDKILEWLTDKHVERGIDLFLIDHINFLFDNSEVSLGEKELTAQRRFMMNLNFLCKKLKLTVIIVSHTNKEGKIYGTTAINQVSTKVIEVSNGEGTQFIVQMRKNRFAIRQDYPHQLNRVGLRLEEYIAAPLLPPKEKKKYVKKRNG